MTRKEGKNLSSCSSDVSGKFPCPMRREGVPVWGFSQLKTVKTTIFLISPFAQMREVNRQMAGQRLGFNPTSVLFFLPPYFESRIPFSFFAKRYVLACPHDENSYGKI